MQAGAWRAACGRALATAAASIEAAAGLRLLQQQPPPPAAAAAAAAAATVATAALHTALQCAGRAATWQRHLVQPPHGLLRQHLQQCCSSSCAPAAARQQGASCGGFPRAPPANWWWPHASSSSLLQPACSHTSNSGHSWRAFGSASSSGSTSWRGLCGSSRCAVSSRLRACGSSRGLTTAADRARARRKRGIVDGGLYLGAVVLGMIGFSYASVPLYRAFCQATGYGGTVSQTHNIEAKLRAREEKPNPDMEAKAREREIRVWFTADVADDMPWSFTPTQDYVSVRPGESVLAFFTAHNKSPTAITGVSTYNVVPDQAAYYFNKVQCFCFEEQRLRGGEEVDMPVFFYVDPEIVTDFNCRNVHDITLSYTFFRVADEDADLSAEAEAEKAAGGGVRLHGAAQLPPGVTPPKLAPGVVAPAGVVAAALSPTAAAIQPPHKAAPAAGVGAAPAAAPIVAPAS